MPEFLQNLTRDAILSIISLLFGALGIVLAVVFYVKGKKSKKPFYQIRSYNIISDSFGNKIKDVEIMFKGQKIKDLTISKIVVWNSGNETINRSDIPDTMKFTIRVKEDIDVYDIEILENTDSANKLSIINQDKQYLIDFDFVDPNQAFIIKITHSGKNSEDISVLGRVKGGFLLEHKNGLIEDTVPLILVRLFPFIQFRFFQPYLKSAMFLIGMTLLSVAIFSHEVYAGRIVVGIFGGLYAIIAIIGFSEKTFPKNISKIFNDE